jgi:hypothetical protein
MSLRSADCKSGVTRVLCATKTRGFRLSTTRLVLGATSREVTDTVFRVVDLTRLVGDLQLAASPTAPACIAGARSDHLAAPRPNALIG